MPPGESRTYDLPLWPERLDTEYAVIVSFRLRRDESWGKRGHEVAFGQWCGGKLPEPACPDGPLEVIHPAVPPLDGPRLLAGLQAVGVLVDGVQAGELPLGVPGETYCDRRLGGKLGVWESTAEDSLGPNLTPQECGNHTGVRWASVTE